MITGYTKDELLQALQLIINKEEDIQRNFAETIDHQIHYLAETIDKMMSRQLSLEEQIMQLIDQRRGR